MTPEAIDHLKSAYHEKTGKHMRDTFARFLTEEDMSILEADYPRRFPIENEDR